MSAPARDKPDRRGRLALIHTAKRVLGLDDEAYRDMLWSIAGERSAKGLTPAQLDRVITRLREMGFEPRPMRKLPHPQQRKIAAMWSQLHREGLVRSRSDRSLDAFVKRMTEIERLEWLPPAECNLVIEALKSWLERKPPPS